MQPLDADQIYRHYIIYGGDCIIGQTSRRLGSIL
jgi:hypothetical protein